MLNLFCFLKFFFVLGRMAHVDILLYLVAVSLQFSIMVSFFSDICLYQLDRKKNREITKNGNN